MSFSWQLLRWGLVMLMVVSAMGAITALGDTLFPKESVGAGFFEDLAGTLITRLRWIHPVLAVFVAGYLVRVARRVGDGFPLAETVERLVYLQVALGVINVALLAPVWMQVVHLFAADVVWVAVVILSAQVLAARQSVTS